MFDRFDVVGEIQTRHLEALKIQPLQDTLPKYMASAESWCAADTSASLMGTAALIATGAGVSTTASVGGGAVDGANGETSRASTGCGFSSDSSGQAWRLGVLNVFGLPIIGENIS